jgi:signal transduction histidine kinase
MNSIVTLAIVYGMMTFGSAGILYFSFRSNLDISAKFFFITEILMFLTTPLVIAQNISYFFDNYISFGLGNFLLLSAEVSLLFSLLSLTRNIKITYFYLALLLAASWCALIEICRMAIDPLLPYLLFNIPTATLGFFTFYQCKNYTNISLRKNLFLKWIGWLEFAIASFAVIRLLGYFSDVPITPRHPTTLVVLMYAIFVALSVFRYISYQSLRISWVNPLAIQSNQLNQSLARVVLEKDQLIQSLMKSNRVLGISALASTLAHELSQPLTSIALETDTIKRDLEESGQNQKSILTLNNISQQLNKITEQIVKLKQLFGSQNHLLHNINIQQITTEILEIIAPTLKLKKIHLNKIFQSNPIAVGDTIQIQQVLINVLNNAVDALSASDTKMMEIILTISQDEKFAKLTIEDNGNGIDTELFPKIFGLYKTSKSDGLGVGLWLSKTIIDKHQGTITAINRDQGGALFEIQIPLASQTLGQA